MTRQAAAAARIMTIRGLLVRAVTAGGAVVILSLVTPAEFGLLAVLRAVTATVEQATELGLAWPLLRKREHPTPEEYTSFAGVQLLILLALLGAATGWPTAATLFGTIDPRWHAWIPAVIAAMLLLPLGTGARIRLERDLRYTRVAFAEVSAILLHTLMLIAFLLLGQFAMGVSVAQITITLYLNGLLYALSPGPFPSWHVGRAVRMLKSSAGYTTAYLVFVAREQAPPLMIAALFGMPMAGIWAFALRLAKFLQFTHEGFARVAVPTAARMSPDRRALRNLVSQSLTGAAVVAIPAAAVVVFALPVVPLFWPQWAAAVPLAQIYVPCDALAGVMAAGLGPVALALYGWRAVLVEHVVPLLIACVGFVLLRRLGRNTLQDVVIPVHIAAIAALFAVTSAGVRPSWNPDFTRLAASLAFGFAVYAGCGALRLPAMATAVAASAVLCAWLWPTWSLHLGRMRGSGS